jgi:benzoyl-CoA 2,3-dioxygenase component B
MSNVDLNEKIPNNVDLAQDKRLLRALTEWQPSYVRWWREMGPADFLEQEVYLRTAVSVDASGWAHFDYVKMPEYRWGIFLADPSPDRRIGFGDHLGEPVWDVLPGEHRNALRRLIVTQGDTEPASVEQQRRLGQTAPSLYDLRNLFQVNVEEGRHLWAMVYLLHRFFGRDGREEAEALLARRSGDADRPRILGAFNQPIENWLDFYMFTMFTDRDGKYQLLALAESGFDPLARTTRFMLTEEAHHMFVGESGVERIVMRTAELMKADPNEDVRAQGGIDLPTIQRYLNLWFALSLDLFGGEISTNAADFFAAGLKGRHKEETYEDHRALDQAYEMEVPRDGRLVREQVPLRNAMNEILRDAYVDENLKTIDYWNRVCERNGIAFRFTYPHRRFHRMIGCYSAGRFDVATGELLDEATWARKSREWLPSPEDKAFVKSLMVPCHVKGKYASWIAPPAKGINDQGVDFEYVKLA